MSQDPESKELLSQIGVLVAKHRRRLGWSQEKLGSYLGLTRAGMANIESGRQNVYLDQLLTLALALRVNLIGLLPIIVSEDETLFLARLPRRKMEGPTEIEIMFKAFDGTVATTESYLSSREDEKPSKKHREGKKSSGNSK